MTTTWEDIRGPLAGGFAEGAMNLIGIGMTNRANQKINERNLEYNAAMTQEQWERDDNAHQREVADLKAAGLSPLASVTGANVSSALGAPNPIAMQAPQFDVNSFLNSVIQNKQLNEIERHDRVQEGNQSIELQNQAEDIKIKADQLKLENKKVEETISYNAKYLTHLSQQLDETKRHSQEEEKQKKLQWVSEQYFNEIKNQTNGVASYKDYFDVDEYDAALQKWTNDFEEFINQFISDTSGSKSDSYTNSQNFSANFGGQIVATGAQGGATEGTSESQSSSTSFNVSQKQQAELNRFYRSHPIPVYHRFNPEDYK